MTSDNVFGSDELTPALLRAVRFAEQDGQVDVAEVRTFLDRVASSLEVFMSADAPSALRAEFARNAEIAQQVLDAGQNASEQLRRQAGEDARRVLDEASEATQRLREGAEGDLARSRAQVEAMRGQFIQELRDLYDRIGASLYRFERAAEEDRVEPIREPVRPATHTLPEAEAVHVAPPVVDAPPRPVHSSPIPAPQPVVEESGLPEGAKPPAWQQLPADAWANPAASEPPSTEDPFAVVEDEPLAPGEPLIDLRELQAELPVVAEIAQPEPPSEAAGSWLDATAAPDAPLAVEPLDSSPRVLHDDALAEALIAGSPFPEDAAVVDPVVAVPVTPVAPTAVDASPDAIAVRQLILDSLAAGQTREAVEAYLREQLGLLEPGVLVDAALGSAGAAGQ